MLVAQNSLGSVCPVPLTVRGTAMQQTEIAIGFIVIDQYFNIKTSRGYGVITAVIIASLQWAWTQYAQFTKRKPNLGKAIASGL